jgi:hypothetical protein
MRQKAIIFLLIMLMGLFVNNVNAASVFTYNNFSQIGDLYTTSGNWLGDHSADEDSIITNLVGVSFEASVTGTLDGITAAIWGPSNYTSESSFSLSLYTDNSGLEGTQIWTQTYSYSDIYCCHESGNGVTDFSISNGNTVTLNANQTYWLLVETPLDVDGTFSWHTNTTGVTGGFRLEMYDEATDSQYLSWHLPDATARAFSVSVETVPLPAAFWLFGSSLVGLGLFRVSGGTRKTN